MRSVVVCGDSRDVLRGLPDNSVDALITDPPYGLSYLGRGWDKVLPDPAIWRECFRIMKPGAHGAIFGFPKLYHRVACAVEDQGFDVRDSLLWLYGEAMPKGPRVDGRGTKLKNGYEPAVIVRKPFRGTAAACYAQYGTGYVNVEEAAAPGGRWPANVVVADDAADVEEWRRYFYCAKPSRAEKEAGLDHLPIVTVDDGRTTKIDNAYLRGKTPRRNSHPTVKPLALMRHAVALLTPPGGLVLDPFVGSGTTGCAAVLEGRRFAGVEIDPAHVRIAEARIYHAESNQP